MTTNFDRLTKGDIINGAYSRLRISGLTVDPTNEDMSTALMRLEIMAHEWRGRSMDAGFNFTQSPEPSDLASIEMIAIEAYETSLAVRLAPDFGNNYVSPELKNQAQQATSNLATLTAKVRETNYPARQPRGSGLTQRIFPWNQYYNATNPPPVTSPVLRLGEVNDFEENFASYLDALETISSHTITPDDGIILISSSVNGSEVRFRLRLDRLSSGNDAIVGESNGLRASGVDISITTSSGRIEKRRFFINTTQ